MTDKVISDARIYTDVQGLERLRYHAKTNSAAATKEVAQQFEAMLMQMVMRSMRDANNSFSSGLFENNNAMEFYQDMFDKQLTLASSSTGNSFAHVIEENLKQQFHIGETAENTDGKKALRLAMPAHGAIPIPVNAAAGNHHSMSLPFAPIAAAPADTTANTTAAKPPVDAESLRPASIFSSPEQFVKTLWSSAKHAASLLGADPRILLAQAALETNWGKKILPHGKDSSTFNLFNIKADNSWDKKATTVDTLEQKNGILAKEKASFRSYDSFVDSFKDYVSFLKSNDRYSEAITKAGDPGQFIHALQKAGFATDQGYADKILKIFSSKMFRNIVEKME